MNKSVLHILNGERGLDTYPSVYNAMHVLSENGWTNNIITGGTIDGFELIINESYRFNGGYLRRAYQLSKLSGNYDLVIVYEPRDVEIYQLSRLLRGKLNVRRLIHHSLEIPTEIMRRSGIKPYVHRFLYKGYLRIDNIIIQDETRAKLLIKHFPDLENIKCSFIPNSYLVDLEPVADKLPWFDKVRKENAFLITYTGAIERWALTLDLFKKIIKNEKVGFLFSGWSYDGFAQEAIEICKNANNVYFDLNIKSRHELNYIVKNSDVGLAIYDSKDPNVAVIGLSSGKMHKFLSYGKPVVANNILSIKNFLENNGFGSVYNEVNFTDVLLDMFKTHLEYESHIRANYFSCVDFRAEYNCFIKSL